MVIVITPRLPPAPDGLGDYCRRLWEHWPEPRPRWTILVTEGVEASRPLWPEARIERFETTTEGLLSALEAAAGETAVLHWVGYGYHPKGCPVWLPGALARWKSARPGRRLVVMLHELWADGPPWSRAFWTHGTQLRIALDTVRLADVVLTSAETLKRQLLEHLPVNAAILPIPSNIPVGHVCWENSAPRDARLRLWTFGLPRVRREALARHLDLIGRLGELGRLERVVVAGAGLRPGDLGSHEARRLRRVVPESRIDVAGELPGAELSRRLAECHLALIRTPAALATKSTTAMAALAHACPIVLVPDAEPAPIEEGRHFLAHDGTRRGAGRLAESLTLERLREVGLAGREWYLAHADWPRIARLWRERLGEAP